MSSEAQSFYIISKYSSLLSAIFLEQYQSVIFMMKRFIMPLFQLSLLLLVSVSFASSTGFAHHIVGHGSLYARDSAIITNVTRSSEGELTHNGGHQNLALAPPLPILQIGTMYMKGQAGNMTLTGNNTVNSTLPHTNSTALQRRQVGTEGPTGPIQCDASTECADKSCCNSVCAKLAPDTLRC